MLCKGSTLAWLWVLLFTAQGAAAPPRRILLLGIVWTLGRPIPKAGLPVDVAEKP